MGGSPHYFIAIHLPEALQEYFSRWQGTLKGKLPYKQWYDKRDLHITLKFLGAVNDNKLQALDQELNQIKSLAHFSIHVGSLGTFGNPINPRVLWAGVEKTKELSVLQQMIEECAVRVGFPEENRDYRPHITLAKKWIGENGVAYDESLRKLKEEYTSGESLYVKEVVIFQIHPGRDQKYEAVRRYSLK